MRRDTQPVPGLGDRLRERRRLMRMSLGDVEAYLGIRASKLSGYENGRATPSVQALLSLCYALNISPNELLAWSEVAQRQLAGDSDVEHDDGDKRHTSIHDILRISGRRSSSTSRISSSTTNP